MSSTKTVVPIKEILANMTVLNAMLTINYRSVYIPRSRLNLDLKITPPPNTVNWGNLLVMVFAKLP
jgi:hypothetical protein